MLCMERRVTFEIAVSYSRGGMFSAFVGDFRCRIGPENRNGARKGSAVAEKTEKYCAQAQQGRGEPRSKSPSPIRAAECFRPLSVIKGVESVRKHETGLEGGQWLLRKFRTRPSSPLLCADCGSDLDFQLSRLI